MKPERPGFHSPMLAKLTSTMPSGPNWYYEVKFDGIRAVAIREAARIRLFSRAHREIGSDYPSIIQALNELELPEFALDGEIVILDSTGRSSFQLLQNFRRRGSHSRLRYVLFDVIHCGGSDVRSLPLQMRRKLLERILPRNRSPLRLSPLLKGSSERIWAEAVRLGLEGIIAKRKESLYDSGRRSGAWLKIKTHHQQEFVIGGYTRQQGSRQHFGAILVGYYEGTKLLFASAVGTGFNTASLHSLHRQFQDYRRADCPFVNLPTKRRGRWGGGLTSTEINRCTWLEPRLVCQVRFQEWTHDGNLRQPVFLGLRKDKLAQEVVRES